MRPLALSAVVVASISAVDFRTAPAHAQATRTWVASLPSGGDDINPCSRTAPCKTFAAALTKTIAGGLINCVDADGFGTITITKSITIDCAGTGGGILATLGANGVTIATANITVILRGLRIEGAGSGGTGVNFLNGSVLHLQDSSISRFSAGLNFAPPSGVTSRLVVTNSSISENAGPGLNIAPTGSGNAKVVLDRAQLDANSAGVFAGAGNGGAVRATIKGSSLSANNNDGIAADGSVGPVQVLIDSSVMSNNGGLGVHSTGANATVIVCCSTMAGNDTGWNSANGAGLGTYGNNNVNMNISGNGSSSFPAPQQ